MYEYSSNYLEELGFPRPRDHKTVGLSIREKEDWSNFSSRDKTRLIMSFCLKKEPRDKMWKEHNADKMEDTIT